MDKRQLRGLLSTLREFGVRSYADADLKLELGDPAPPVETKDAEGTGELSLPPGTPDPAAMIRELYAQRAAAAKAKRS